MTDQSIMPFGAHKGKQLADVPDSYFLWLWHQDWFAANKSSELYLYVKGNLDTIKANIKRNAKSIPLK